MKKNFIIILLLFAFMSASAQFLKKEWGNDSIYIYEDAYSQPYSREIPIDTIWQGLWGPDSMGSFYDIEILESTGLRHKILYRPSQDAERYANFDSTDSIFNAKIGWVDKKDVVVFLWPELVEVDSSAEYKYFSVLNLFNHPCDSVPLNKISMNYAFDDENDSFEFFQPGPFSITMPIIETSPLSDANGKKWLKVLFIGKDGPIEGWTVDYCPYIGGCYGW